MATRATERRLAPENFILGYILRMKRLNPLPPIIAVFALVLTAVCTSAPPLPPTQTSLPASAPTSPAMSTAAATLTATPMPSSTPSATPTGLAGLPRLLTGVNLAGADFGPVDRRPGVYGQDYFYPTHAEVDYFVGKGMT